MSEILNFYQKAKTFILKKGFEGDIKYAASLDIQKTTYMEFLHEFIWCVLNAGMKEQVARKIYDNFIIDFDLTKIKHLGKQAAIEKGLKCFREWFDTLLAAKNQVNYLETLPWIGPITKFHLARNIGIDCVKPDRHLTRLAKRFKFNSPLEMCKVIQEETKERLGVIDIILWRYCNLKGKEKDPTIPSQNLEHFLEVK